MCMGVPDPFIKHCIHYPRFSWIGRSDLFCITSYISLPSYQLMSIFTDFFLSIISPYYSSFLQLSCSKEWPKFDLHSCVLSLSFPAFKITNGHHFSKSNTFLFSYFLTSREQAVDMFVHSFLLQRLSSPDLQDIIFSRLSSHLTKLLCLLSWALFCSTSRCWRTARFFSTS